MKILTKTGLTLTRSTVTKRSVTITLGRSGAAAVELTSEQTAQKAMAGAVLAGLALSQTLFHTRASRAEISATHAKLRV